MKKTLLILPLFLLCVVLSSCTNESSDHNPTPRTIVDSMGNSFVLADNPRVVSCYGSFADMWQLSGGKLIGVTKDTIEEHNLPLPQNIDIVGTVKEINLEKLVSLNPDYVILSKEVAAHLSIEESLKSMEIAYGYFQVDSFDDYKNIMKQFCRVNNRSDLFQKNVIDVETNFRSIISNVPRNSNPSFLVMRSFSTGIKVKNDNLAVSMLKDLEAMDITDKTPSILKDFSLEKIIVEDPDFIFVLTMGDETAARDYLFKTIEDNPAWNELSAIKNNRLIILPKELFHYKPNNRWDESYAYLTKILYPELIN